MEISWKCCTKRSWVTLNWLFNVFHWIFYVLNFTFWVIMHYSLLFCCSILNAVGVLFSRLLLVYSIDKFFVLYFFSKLFVPQFCASIWMIKSMLKRYWEAMFVQSNRVNFDGSPVHLPRLVCFSEFVYAYAELYTSFSPILFLCRKSIFFLS